MNVLEPLLPAEDELQVSARGVGLFQLHAWFFAQEDVYCRATPVCSMSSADVSLTKRRPG